MPASNRWKLLSVLILVIVAVAGIGSYVVLNKPIGPSTFISSSAVTILSATQKTAAATTTTFAPVQWITVSQVRSVNYYVSLLESNGTQPYVQLANELQKLPDYSNATAVAEITLLALNATNPEVKEAFELMMRGGTPDSRDYSYPVPTYNTELEILYWLACQNAFKKDDTLALAVAMSNGIWVSMGTDQVQLQVRKDTSDLLLFYRETNELQEQRGYPQLENYPLEAKVGLGWTGSLSMHWMGDRTQLRYPASLVFWKAVRLPLIVYEKDTVSVETLRKMRDLAISRGWWEKDVNLSIGTMERYFYFTPGNWREIERGDDDEGVRYHSNEAVALLQLAIYD